MLTAGIVGCGRMGRERARCASALGISVASVFDPDGTRARALADSIPGCMVQKSAVDVVASKPAMVFVCTPPFARGPIESVIIAERIPLFVEKPIGVTACQVAHVHEALGAAPLVHAVGYHNRCRGSVRHLKALLSGIRVIGVSAYWVGDKYAVPWWLPKEQSGGPANDQLTHLVDLCREFCGEVATIAKVRPKRLIETSESRTFGLSLAHDNGALSNVLYSCEALTRQICFRVMTEKGGASLTSWNLSLTENDIDQTGLSLPTEDIFLVETECFLKAIVSQRLEEVGCTFSEAWKTQQLMDRILSESAEGILRR